MFPQNPLSLIGLAPDESSMTFAWFLGIGWKSLREKTHIQSVWLKHTFLTALLHFACVSCGLKHKSFWLSAIPSRHHLEPQQERVSEPWSEIEPWQDGERNMCCVSCQWLESTPCIFLARTPLSSPHFLFNDLFCCFCHFITPFIPHWRWREGLWLVEVKEGWSFLC